MKFKYLVFSGYTIWGKNELSREYFVAAVQRGDAIINLEDGTYFNKDTNSWLPVEGDNEKS
jgi:hypothetical protein